MKIFLILTLFVFISCEQQSGTEEQVASPGTLGSFETPTNQVAVVEKSGKIGVELVEGFYRSGCVDYNGEKVEFYLNIEAYAVQITKKEGVNSNCEGLKDQITAKLDINGEYFEYDETEYLYFTDGGGSFPCGQSHMSSGSTYSIDGIGCSESFENTSVEVSKDDQGYYVIDGVVFDS